MGWKQLMEQQFPQARRRCHIIEAKVQAPVELEPSNFSRNENSVESAVNAMSLIYSAARPRHQNTNIRFARAFPTRTYQTKMKPKTSPPPESYQHFDTPAKARI